MVPSSAPNARSRDRRARSAASGVLPWLLPVLAATYLVGFAPGSSLDGIPYANLILGPVAAFLVASLLVVGVGPSRAPAAARITIAVGLILAASPVALAAGEAEHLLHFGLRGQELLALAMLGGAVAAGGRITGLSGRRPTAFVVLVAVAVAAMVETDVRVIGSVFDRDLLLYLRAGSALLHGSPVYTEDVLVQVPHDPTLLPFVYPPVSLPFLAILSVLPRPVVELAWFSVAASASVAALRCFGVRWQWVPILLAWPPFIQGLWTGNANALLLLAFAAAPFAPSLLALPPLIKVQLGITGLWLPRERRWNALIRGLIVAGVLILVTLPIVGLESWQDWLGGLAAFAQTITRLPPLEGLALTRSVGPAVAIVLTAAVVLIALLRRGRDGLATFGLASVVSAPTLYLHGMTPSLPSLLRLRGAGLWFLLAVTASFAHGETWWLVVAILVLAPMIPALVDGSRLDAAVHPLGRVNQPWLTNPP